jgi:NitT/TauT family transport system ATP-binding protein
MALNKLLELKGVTKIFNLESGRELKVLENINIELYEDQVLALLGPSGSGKSTCLRIMCGLQTATSGQVLSKGRDLCEINGDVSLVFQSFALLPWETIKKNIEIALYPLEISPTDLKERVKRAIDIVGLEGFEEAYPRELSGGMKQRVGVARALAMQRPILFLDEPFSALDVLTADTLRDEIMKIYLGKKTATRAMLVVTHNIQEAVLMADRILIMGSHPGHVRAEFKNDLPYPRNPESQPFIELVSKIHGTITETFIPDLQPGSAATRPVRGPVVEVLPNVQMLELEGLLDAIRAEGGAVDLFVLALDIGKDFGQTLYMVKAAELLGLVDTPRQNVVLTRVGQAFASADINQRKQMINEQFRKLLIVQRTTELLKQSEIVRMSIETLKQELHSWLPNEDADRIVATLISWGRYAEYFGYNDDTKSIYLDVGQEVH